MSPRRVRVQPYVGVGCSLYPILAALIVWILRTR
jgi:hypothetical protein